MSIALPMYSRARSRKYRTTATDYDGISDYARRGADLTGIADGKQFTFSCFLRMDADGATRRVIHTPGSNLQLIVLPSGRIQIAAENAAGANILNVVSPDTAAGKVLVANGFSSIVVAADLAVTNSVKITIRGSVVVTGSGSNQDIDFTTGNFNVAYESDGAGSRLNGCLSELFFHTSYIDLSAEANRRKFVSESGKPVFLGADGSLPLGMQPLIYAPNGLPTTNLGTGGNFTAFGAPAVCSTSPSD